MTTYDYSTVLLIPDVHRAELNALAEEWGWGPDNLAVPLIHTDGSQWWGCHAWAAASFFADIAGVEPTPTLAALRVSAIQNGDPSANWAQALADNSLTALEA